MTDKKITTEKNDANTPAMDDPRNTYFAVFKYDVPTEGTVSISGRDVEHAKSIVNELLSSKKNAVIVDIFDVRNAPPTDQSKLLDLAEHYQDEFEKKQTLN